MMKKKVPAMSSDERLCNLMVDEMCIKKSLHYDPSKDKVEGYATISEKQQKKKAYLKSATIRKPEKQVADHALVFMLRGIKNNWKQPFSFYFSAVIRYLANNHTIFKSMCRGDFIKN